MFPVRQRGQRWRRILCSVDSFVAGPVIIHCSIFIIPSAGTPKLTDGGVALWAPTFVPVDAQGDFVLMCDYTGKEVVE
jgi:hypothetical protein